MIIAPTAPVLAARDGKEVIIHKDGDRLIIEPVPPPRLLAVLATLDPIDETFPDIHDPMPEPVDL